MGRPRPELDEAALAPYQLLVLPHVAALSDEDRHGVLTGLEETGVTLGMDYLVPVQAAPGSHGAALTLIPPYISYPPEEAFSRTGNSGLPLALLTEAQAGEGRHVFFPGNVDVFFMTSNAPDYSRLLRNAVEWAFPGEQPTQVSGPGLISQRAGVFHPQRGGRGGIRRGVQPRQGWHGHDEGSDVGDRAADEQPARGGEGRVALRIRGDGDHRRADAGSGGGPRGAGTPCSCGGSSERRAPPARAGASSRRLEHGKRGRAP